jgi:membrane associated rhomboid family serine protease
MSIYDRDYMSGTDEAMHAGGRRWTAFIVILIVNIVVWVVWQFARTDFGLARFMTENFTASTTGVLSELRVHTLATYAFSHMDLWHIFFNMLFLWIVAEDVERLYGYRNFYWLYVFCAVVAAVAFLGVHLARGQGGAMLGASGSVMGIAVVAAIFHPRKPIAVWGILTVPLGILVLIYLGLDLLTEMSGGDFVARTAHLGGAAAGALFWKLDLRLFGSPGREHAGLLSRIRRWWHRPPLRVVERVPDELPPEFGQPAETSEEDKPVDATTGRRVDELLAKISRQGIGALSDEERAFLAESSRKYKKE